MLLLFHEMENSAVSTTNSVYWSDMVKYKKKFEAKGKNEGYELR